MPAVSTVLQDQGGVHSWPWCLVVQGQHNRVHYVALRVAWSLVALGLVGRISPKQANQTHNHQKPWWTVCIPWGFVFVLCKMNVLLAKVKRGCAPISHCAVHSTEGKLKIRCSFQTYSKCNHQVWMHCIRWSWMYLNKGYFT